MGQLKKRLISSAFFVTLALTGIFFFPGWLFFGVIEIFIFLALREFLIIAERKGVIIHHRLGIALGLFIPFAVVNSFDFLALMVSGFILLISYFRKKIQDSGFVGTALTFFGLTYVSWFFSHILVLRNLESGPWWVLFTVLLVKGGDAGAYFIGKAFGRNKLIEHISPNKSVEGAVAGFVATVLLAWISKLYLPDVSFLHLTVMGAAVAILGQLADLTESSIKRDVGIKDSGEVPGLGGFLDVLDSLLVTVPFVYYYVTRVLGAA